MIMKKKIKQGDIYPPSSLTKNTLFKEEILDKIIQNPLPAYSPPIFTDKINNDTTTARVFKIGGDPLLDSSYVTIGRYLFNSNPSSNFNLPFYNDQECIDAWHKLGYDIIIDIASIQCTYNTFTIVLSPLDIQFYECDNNGKIINNSTSCALSIEEFIVIYRTLLWREWIK